MVKSVSIQIDNPNKRINGQYNSQQYNSVVNSLTNNKYYRKKTESHSGLKLVYVITYWWPEDYTYKYVSYGGTSGHGYYEKYVYPSGSFKAFSYIYPVQKTNISVETVAKEGGNGSSVFFDDTIDDKLGGIKMLLGA